MSNILGDVFGEDNPHLLSIQIISHLADVVDLPDHVPKTLEAHFIASALQLFPVDVAPVGINIGVAETAKCLRCIEEIGSCEMRGHIPSDAAVLLQLSYNTVH